MFERILLFLRGNLLVTMYGINPERYLTLCANAGLIIKNLRRTKNGYQGWLSLPDYRTSLPLAKKSRTLLQIEKKSGFPFFLYRNRTRKAFALGLSLGLCLLLFLSSFLWDIQLEGNQYYTDDALLHFLQEQQIFHGMKMSEIACDRLEQEIRIAYPHITWVSAQISGTRLILNVKENFSRMEMPSEEKLPCDLVAPTDGVITSIVTRSGIPMVKAGDRVTAGQVLVSGRVPLHNDSAEVVGWTEVAADADVRARTEKPYRWQRSILKEETEVAGRRICGLTLQLGDRLFSMGEQTAESPYHVTLTEYRELKLFYNFRLPLSLSLTSDCTCRIHVRKMSEEELWEAAEERFGEYQKELEERGTVLVDQRLTLTADELWLTMEGTLTLEENFSREVPLADLEEGMPPSSRSDES